MTHFIVLPNVCGMALGAALRGSSPSGEAARYPDRRQALGDCDKLATNAHVPLRSSASCHAPLEINSIPPNNARLEGAIAQFGAALWKVG